MGSGDERRLREVVTEVTAQAGYDLEELAVRSAGRRRVVRVVIDGDSGVTLDAAAEVSRAISERLDESGPDDPTGSTPYTLEVTSPGVGRPLSLPRHFRRARTRLVVVRAADGTTTTGHVLGVTDTAVTLVLSGRAGVSRVEVPFADIDHAKVEVEFHPAPAAVRALLGVEPAAEPEDVEPDDVEPDAGDADGEPDALGDDELHDDKALDDEALDDVAGELSAAGDGATR